MNYQAEINKHLKELNGIEKMLDSLTPFSDDWFVWNELRQEEERTLHCLIKWQKATKTR